jgi:hypothetical protein
MNPKAKRGRPRRTQKMVKFSVFVAEADYRDLRVMGKQTERPMTFITARLIAEGVDRWRRERGSSLFPLPVPPPSGPVVLADAPTDSGAIQEAVRAALAAQETQKASS